MTQGNQERIQQIWVEITQWEAQKSSGVSLQTQEQIDRDIKAAKKVIAELESEDQAAEQAEREQQIEDKVASIELPYDFNDLYENSTANATIIEIVQQFKRQDLVDHNAEIERLTQLHKEQMQEQMRASNDRESQLQRQNKELQNDLHENLATLGETSISLKAAEEESASLKLQLKEANFTRDNAATQLEEANAEIARLKSHIDDLVKEQAVGAREAHKVIETNQTLNELIERANAEKQAKIKSSSELAAEGALGFRGKVTFPTTNQQEQPFRIENSGKFTSDAGIVQVLAAENEDMKAPQFPTSEPSVVGPIAIPGQSTDSGVEAETAEGPITREWVKEYVKVSVAQAIADIRGEQVA